MKGRAVFAATIGLVVSLAACGGSTDTTAAVEGSEDFSIAAQEAAAGAVIVRKHFSPPTAHRLT